MVKLDGGWRWVVATPTHDVYVMNLSGYCVVPLSWGQLIPGPPRRDLFGFGPLTDEGMRGLMAEAQLLAVAMGPRPRLAEAWRIIRAVVKRNDLLLDFSISA